MARPDEDQLHEAYLDLNSRDYEPPEPHFCESPACTLTPSCVGWSAGYHDPEADQEAYLHALACCPAGHYGCECDGTDCPFERAPEGEN